MTTKQNIIQNRNVYQAENGAYATITYRPLLDKWMLWVDGGIIGGKYGCPSYPNNGMFDSFLAAYTQMQSASLRFEFVNSYAN